MTKPKIVVADGFDKALFSSLLENPAFQVHPESKVSQDELPNLLKEAEGLVIRSATTVTSELVDNSPNLKYVIRAGEGTDNIDKKYCNSKGVKVSNTPGANNNSAAEHAIALMFTLLRKTAEANNKMKSGGWDKNLYVGTELSNKKLGIVGFGRIGQIVAKRLAGFDLDIHFFDPFVTQDKFPNYKKVEDLNEIFAVSDIVTLHLPLLEQTKNMITAEQLSKMQSHAILVNASRGKIVNETDLEAILKENKIAAAAFDVFATEPLPQDSSLRNLDNLILTPHLGASTKEAQKRVGQMVINQLEEFFLKDNLLNEVN